MADSNELYQLARTKLLNERARKLKIENDQRETNGQVIKCPACDGWGRRFNPPPYSATWTPDDPTWWTPCPACNGMGLIRSDILLNQYP